MDVHLGISEHALAVPGKERWALAKELGCDGIELSFGPFDVESHPLRRLGGPAELQTEAQAAGLALASVHAGYFSQHPLIEPDASIRQSHVEVVDRLIDACGAAGIGVILLPLMGRAELRSDDAAKLLVETLSPFLEKVAARNMVLALAAPLPEVGLQALLTRFRHPAVRVAYNVSHAASLGFDAIHDLKLLGDSLAQVRLKLDYLDFTQWPQLLSSYRGWLILEKSAAADSFKSIKSQVAALRRVLPANET